MWNQNDIKQLQQKGISPEKAENQINTFKNGVDFMDITKPALVGDGLIKLVNKEFDSYIELYNQKFKSKKITKFVPASGAASRMFKTLFGFLASDNKQDELKDKSFNSVANFFEKLKKFAFYEELKKLPQLKGIDFNEELGEKDFQLIVEALLSSDGLNYGNLPKGLLKFHKGPAGVKTPVQEHMAEGALYASTGNKVHIHFTVSPEHMDGFKKHIKEVKPILEAQFEMQFEIAFSVQKSSTDTLAVDLNNKPFRNEDGSILFRPGGHGALIENLNEIDADLIFVKNIDNVVPDRLKQDTINYKKALAGLLFKYQDRIFNYLERLEANSDVPEVHMGEIENFVSKELYISFPKAYQKLAAAKKVDFLKKKLNRPIRVCGMVKNEGEPGGGPFWACNPDKSISLQIVESSQIDLDDNNKREIVKQASHFNPVDLVCATKDFKGKAFDLARYIDPDAGFISEKSKDGKDLKALELPGLWNGAMSDWNTLFVEVPLSTFNPVKTVNDLLRPQHQPAN